MMRNHKKMGRQAGESKRECRSRRGMVELLSGRWVSKHEADLLIMQGYNVDKILAEAK